jgi:hypothetical protein
METSTSEAVVFVLTGSASKTEPIQQIGNGRSQKHGRDGDDDERAMRRPTTQDSGA